MIALLTGKLVYKCFEYLIVNVGGVGYQVQIPLSTFYKVPQNDSEVSLHIYTHVREDALQLFGFLTPEEKGIFQLLVGVSGIGPRLARNILSGIPAEELRQALSSGDRGRLSAIPGVGRKTAERLVLELKDKIPGMSRDEVTVPEGEAGHLQVMDDVLSALVNLGYRTGEVKKALDRVGREGKEEADFEHLFKDTLRFLAR
ncbi:MAG: Holliday junction branch migration protein RuvA [Deltaproteobacteria bacterium]|nr:MAG: Holliday junction branch migration protein RuvA [Deltaproteobacteria bacterium]